jgi:hypothetical protein
VILSAPSTYPFPDPATPWPNGMGKAGKASFAGGPPASGIPAGRDIPACPPRPANWLAAATGVMVNVLVGSRDTEPRPAAPGQPGATRVERARTWVESMHRYSGSTAGRPPSR